LIEIETGGAPLAALVAHDWGGAVAWNLANQHPQRMHQLVIINSPHPGTFLRELQRNPAQQAASAYMNFLIRPDAARLLAADGYARLFGFFEKMGAASAPGTPGAPIGAGWLSDGVRAQYRAVWDKGLDGGLNYYRASPLRPASDSDPAASAVTLPPEAVRVDVPTLVLWAQDDVALLPALCEGLQEHVPDLRLVPLPQATHWVVHEQPQRVIAEMAAFLNT
jgi:pimeloyl-ACP methyl ester carboxylesterase